MKTNASNAMKKNLHSPSALFLQWWVIPGFIGIFSMLFGKFIIGIVMTFSSREPLSRGVNKTADKMVEELGYLGDLDFSSTDIWAYMLFGMLLGIFIKYAYSDEAI